MTFNIARAALFTGASVMALSASAQAAELDLMISDVDGKAGLVRELADRYTAEHPDVTINLNTVGYNVIPGAAGGPA